MRTIASFTIGRFARSWIAAAAGLWLAGCASVPPGAADVRSQIESGSVAIGASTAAVVQSLGEPHLKLVPEGGPQGSERWVYTERRIEQAGTFTVNRFETHYDREGRIYSHFIMPEEQDNFVTQVRVVALLTFKGGRLVAIDLQTADGATQPPSTSGPNA